MVYFCMRKIQSEKEKEYMVVWVFQRILSTALEYTKAGNIYRN